MMTTGDVAKYLDVSISTVRHWVKQGYLPVAWKTPTGYLKFDEDAVLQVKKDCIENGSGVYGMRCSSRN